MFGFPITGYKHILSICLQLGLVKWFESKPTEVHTLKHKSTHTHTPLFALTQPQPPLAIGDDDESAVHSAQWLMSRRDFWLATPCLSPSLPPSLPFPLCPPLNHCMAVRHQSIANRKQISNQANWSLGLLWGLGPALSLWPGCGRGGNGIRGKGQAHCLSFAGGPHLRNKKLQAGRGAVAGAEGQGWGGFRWG